MIWQDPVDYSHITYEYDHSLLEQVGEVVAMISALDPVLAGHDPVRVLILALLLDLMRR